MFHGSGAKQEFERKDFISVIAGWETIAASLAKQNEAAVARIDALENKLAAVMGRLDECTELHLADQHRIAVLETRLAILEAIEEPKLGS